VPSETVYVRDTVTHIIDFLVSYQLV